MKDISQVMKINPATLYQEQHEALSQHVLAVLDEVRCRIERGEYQAILNKLINSPAGDSYGSENLYIDFSYSDDEVMDIGEAVEKLQELTKKAE